MPDLPVVGAGPTDTDPGLQAGVTGPDLVGRLTEVTAINGSPVVESLTLHGNDGETTLTASGLFVSVATGAVRAGTPDQLSTAFGDGVTAATAAARYLEAGRHE